MPNFLQIDKPTARRLYKNVPEWFQDILEMTYGKETFTHKIIDLIKTQEDAFKEKGIKYEDLISDHLKYHEIARRILELITELINEEWKADFTDTTQKKWYPWFKVSSSGLVFDNSYCAFDCTATACGSRLCFETKEKSDYVGQTFIKIFETMLLK